jgi:DNA-binding LacI/PurR family transcriptional regulator
MMGANVERILASWREHDIARAIHPADRDAIRVTDAARALVIELFDRPARDLFNACALLGRLLADAGASPSFAVSTIDGAASALRDARIGFDEERIAPSRASIAEGYVSALRDLEREEANRAWTYPSCVVTLDDETVAIAAGYPGDGDGLGDWAAKIASKLSQKGTRTAIVAGSDPARREVLAALNLVGISVVDRLPSRGWLRLPWKR